MDEETVNLRIPTARQKLQVNFPKDPKGDFRLVLGSKVLNLQKAYLRLQSTYFKRVCTFQTNLHEIKQDFDEQFFYNIMKCFYGATVQVLRKDLPHYYPIIRYLEIESLLQFVQKDILEHIEEHDLFLIMKIAHKYSEQGIFQVCLEQLEKQSFHQLNYEQYELLQTQPGLFKLIIKMHNRFKATHGGGLSYVQIDKLLSQYCESQGLREEKYHEFKFELIDRTALSSAEYKEIFLDEAMKMKIKASEILQNPQLASMTYPQQGYGFSQPSLTSFSSLNNLSESYVSPLQKNNLLSNISSSGVSNDLTREMQITFERKLNQQLREQNKQISEELHNLRRATSQNHNIHLQMENQLRILKEELRKKEAIQKEHKKTISKFETIIGKMQRDLEEKSDAIESLCAQFEYLRNRKPMSSESSSDQGEQPEMFIESQFLPAHLINEMMAPPKKENKPGSKKPQSTIKGNESLDEEELEQMYMPRLGFDEHPISTPKIHLPKVATFICGEDFKKKNLHLIYRRSQMNPPKGRNFDIREKGPLLILIKTSTEQNIGGYITTTIPGNIHDESLADSGAMIFTLTKNQKFEVKKTQINEAIFMSDLYLISFANDLMISNDCLTEQSYCSWPSSYQSAKNIKQRGVSWFVGGGQNFFIKQLEIYEIQEEQMEMML